MKRFLISNLLVLSALIGAKACGGEEPARQYELFSIVPYLETGNLFTGRTDAFWMEYTKGEMEYEGYDGEAVLKIAEKKGDKEMVAYLNHLNDYLEICYQLKDPWTYPTKEELKERKNTLRGLLVAAEKYAGTRLRPQYFLLAMRANMMLKNHAANKDFWQNKASLLGESVYKDMMKNIYAGALLNLGNKLEAWNIFTEQGDMESLRWSVRGYAGLAGMQTVYGLHPNAEVLKFLLQDYIYDLCRLCMYSPESTGSEVAVLTKEMQDFAAFSQMVLNEGKTENPSMWLMACAMVHYCTKQYSEAFAEIDRALKAGGTERMKESARCIRLLVSTKSFCLDKKYEKYVAGELNWLDGKAMSENGSGYYNMARSLIDEHGIVPMLKKAGRVEMAMAFEHNVEDYSSTQVIRYLAFVNGKPKSPLEKYILPKADKDADHFNDVIGMKCIAEGKLAEALVFLEKIPLDHYKGKSISWYMSHRDYTKARWFGKQKTKPYDSESEGVEITVNRRIAFCKEMIQLAAQNLLSSDDEVRKKTAYEMAVRYYQASHGGDCWYLCHDYWSACENRLKWECDFSQMAVDKLNDSKTSIDFDLRQKSLYALAFIPYNDSGDVGWYDSNVRKSFEKQQRAALMELNAFYKENHSRVAQYITRCDVFGMFRKSLQK